MMKEILKRLALGLVTVILISFIVFYGWHWIFAACVIGVFSWGAFQILWFFGNMVGCILFDWEDKL